MYAVESSTDNEQPAVALTWWGSMCFMEAFHIFSLMNESILFIEFSKGKKKRKKKKLCFFLFFFLSRNMIFFRQIPCYQQETAIGDPKAMYDSLWEYMLFKIHIRNAVLLSSLRALSLGKDKQVPSVITPIAKQIEHKGWTVTTSSDKFYMGYSSTDAIYWHYKRKSVYLITDKLTTSDKQVQDTIFVWTALIVINKFALIKILLAKSP